MLGTLRQQPHGLRVADYSPTVDSSVEHGASRSAGYDALVKPISSRGQLWLIAFGYAAILAVAAALLLGRYLQEVTHPADAQAYGGMYAFGDAVLGIFIACLFMIPTVFLVRVMARFEAFYTAYSQLLVGISLSAPVCLGLLYFGKDHVAENLRNLCLYRFLCSPFILVGIGVSRWVARSDRAKKLTSYALLIEGLTLGIAVTLLIRG